MAFHAQFRFYEELNDFLAPYQRKQSIEYVFDGHPAVKDAIEAQGVPHTEVDLILINGKSVRFTERMHDRDRVAVYPMFESLDISPVQRLRPLPLRDPKFILDIQLGKLARKLRMLGIDAVYRNNYRGEELIRLAQKENRIILTRHIGLLKHGDVTHGYWLRSDKPEIQCEEVVKRFDLVNRISPFARCMECNGPVKSVQKEKIMNRLLPKTRIYYDSFFQCQSCDKVYWKGTHYQRMMKNIAELTHRIDQTQSLI